MTELHEPVAIESSDDSASVRLGAALLHIARAAIGKRLGELASAPPDDSPTSSELPRLSESGASFITLTKHGELRGCIGSLEPRRSLSDDVFANAQAAAFDDPRFPPVTRAEWPDVRVEVSLLSSPQAMHLSSENDALAQLRPGIDGIILKVGHRRATFLPQVWESLPRPQDFLGRLKEKAGLSADYWGNDLQLARYTVSKWREDLSG